MLKKKKILNKENVKIKKVPLTTLSFNFTEEIRLPTYSSH